MPRISVIAEINPKEGCYADVEAIVREHAEFARTEEPEGCLSFEAMQALDKDGDVDRSKIMIIVIYRNMDAVRSHFANLRMKDLQTRMEPLCDGRQMVICEMQE
jgi:quinol monooxygenase YgiN